MQPTVIKIKFTPIIKHLQKDHAHCCLEIMPDVSCIQNLDTIEWNDNKLIEYSVPVNYKIILKRFTQEDTTKQEKMYYSCIDLRLLSSNSTFACGDIAKVFSENYILRKYPSDFESSEMVTASTGMQSDSKNNDALEDKDSFKMTEELSEGCSIPSAIKEGEEMKIDQDNIKILPQLESIEFVEYKKPNTHSCSECIAPKQTITDIKNNKKKKLKLTITSVCTLSTIESPINGRVYNEVNKNSSTISLKYKSTKKTDFRISKVAESIDHRSFYSENNRLRLKNAFHERVLPEIRVARFMMSVENEILPLKILLTEIYRKCALLGLMWESNSMPDSVPAVQSKCIEKTQVLSCKETKPKCNRVVYSFVFEE